MGFLEISHWLDLLFLVERTGYQAAGWTRFDVLRTEVATGQTLLNYLGRYGIKVGGLGITDKHLIFHVPPQQARMTEYWLNRIGIHPKQVLDPRNAANAAKYDGQAPPAWKDKR